MPTDHDVANPQSFDGIVDDGEFLRSFVLGICHLIAELPKDDSRICRSDAIEGTIHGTLRAGDPEALVLVTLSQDVSLLAN